MNRRQLLVQKQFLNNEKAVVERLQYIYDQSLFEINEKIRNLEFSIGDLQEEYDWMDADDPKKEIIKSQIQSKIYQKQYQQVLQDQVDGILKQMQTKQFLTISDYLDVCYEDGFVGSLFDLHGQNVPMMMPIDQEAMVRAVQLDSKISEGLYTRLGEDVGVLKKRITSEVTRSIATGASFEKTAQRLAGQTKIGYNKAVRIARTEGHRIQCSATMDVMHNAKDMGADVVKQWDATLDGKTRPEHRKVDGEIREVDEPFSNGLDFPGDPAGGAAEVVNCRCALLQRARWALDDGFTKMDNFTKQLETFDSPQKYDEFKTGFFSDGNVKYMNYVQQMWDKYGTRDLKKVLSQMTTREYNHYSKLLANNPVFNTKKKTKNDVVYGAKGLTKPTRPKKVNFATHEQYQEALEQYRSDKATYEQRMVDIIQGNLDRKPKFETIEAVNEWAEKTGIKVSDDFVKNIDLKAFNDIVPVAEEMFEKYPFTKGYKVIDFSDGNDFDFTFEFGWLPADENCLMEAGAGIKFCERYFKNYGDAIEATMESVIGGWTVVGDGTIRTSIRHEFGHEVFSYIKQISRTKYGSYDRAWEDVRSIAQKKPSGTSEYALSTYEEFFAEGFAEYESGADTELAKEFGELLKRWL